MSKTILAVGIFLLAGANAAYAQHAGGMNPSSAAFGGGGGFGSSGISMASAAVHSKPAPLSGVNVSARNDGPFVPTTYANYTEAVTEGETELHVKPVNLGDLSRQVREQNKTAGEKARILIDQNAYGRIEITPREP